MKLHKLKEDYSGDSSKVSGFSHTLVKRQGNIAIYKQTPNKGGMLHYEVIVIEPMKVDKRELFAGTLVGYTHYEKYPSSSSWGEKGWSYIKLENAEKKFNELIDKK